MPHLSFKRFRDHGAASDAARFIGERRLAFFAVGMLELFGRIQHPLRLGSFVGL